jgi:hypothetical protein
VKQGVFDDAVLEFDGVVFIGIKSNSEGLGQVKVEI